MMRTQIQLPDELYEKAKRLADQKEISLAEVVRRGLEYLLTIQPDQRPAKSEWSLMPPVNTGLRRDPFQSEDWREQANLGSGSTTLRAQGRRKPSKRGRS